MARPKIKPCPPCARFVKEKDEELAAARERIALLETACEHVYDALWNNLANMSQINQDALRPAAMNLLAALAGERR